MFSAYWCDPTHGWMGTHRLPLKSAIFQCREIHRRDDIPVAIVPDDHDPAFYFQLAMQFA